MKKRLIFWDIDGTLMYCGSNGTMALNKTFRDIYGIEDAFEKAGIGRAMDAVILENIFEGFRIPDPDREGVMARYIANLGEILKQNEQKRVMPGVPQLLDYIDRHPSLFNGILTSNFRLGAWTKLDSVDILGYFKVGGFGDIIGEKWDAALRGVMEAERFFGVSFHRSDVIIIGDSAYDIECAKRLGMISIGVATGWTDYETLGSHEPDYLFHDLTDYSKIIDIIGSNK